MAAAAAASLRDSNAKSGGGGGGGGVSSSIALSNVVWGHGGECEAITSTLPLCKTRFWQLLFPSPLPLPQCVASSSGSSLFLSPPLPPPSSSMQIEI